MGASAAAVPRAASRRISRATIRRNVAGWLFVAPALAVFAVFILYSALYSLALSFYEWDGFHPEWGDFVGLQNYVALGRDEVFWKAVGNSLVFVLVRTPLEVGLGLVFALLLNGALRGRAVLRTIYFVPVVLSLIVVTLIFQRIYEANTGLLNTFLRSVGLDWLALQWLGDASTALPSVIAVSVWKNVGFSLVILLAGLQSIPHEIIEAAQIDGAGGWRLVTRITLPLMREIVALTTVLSVIGSLKVFDLVFIMTRGGPTYATEVLATLLYRQAFELNEVGLASAVAMVMVGLILVSARAQFLVVHSR